MSKFEHNSEIFIREPRWSSIDQKRLPEQAGVDGEYFHHWVRNAKGGKGKTYSGGELLLHKGGLISAIREAEQKKDKDALKHLALHKKAIGLEEDMAMKRTMFKAQKVNMDNSGLSFERAHLTAEELSLGDRIPTDISSRLMKSESDITDRDMDAINRIAKSPLNREDVFVFPMWISNDLNDAYYTRMMQSSLENFVLDLGSSRALQLGHGGGFFGSGGGISMPIGASFNGEKRSREGYEGDHILGWYYVVRGLNTGIGNMTTLDIERNIEAGVYRRGSIGFTISPIEGRAAGRYICSICRSNLVSYDCPHIPGLRYEDEDGNIHTCIAEIHGAGMRESSLVPMNAAQGTVVEKARQFVSEGKLSEKNARILEYAYNTRVLIDGPTTPSITPPVREEVPAGKREPKNEPNQEEVDMEQLLTFVRSLSEIFPDRGLDKIEMKEDSDISEVRKSISEAVEEIRSETGASLKIIEAIPEDLRSVEKVTELVKESGWGRSYKEDLIKDTIAEGIRAHGNDFDQDHWRSYLEGQTEMEPIRKARDSFRKAADQKIQPGQKSRAEDNQPRLTAKAPAIPDTAHKMGR